MTINIQKVIRSKRKTLAIIINESGAITIRAPMRTPDQKIREFIEQHKAWIEKKLIQIQSRVVEPPKQFIPGETFLVLGKSYPLEVVKDQKQALILDGKFKLSQSMYEKAELIFERWYRMQARKILEERVRYFAAKHDLQYQGIKITSAKTRWGSCNSSGFLNFSWRLIQAPLEQVDYVVVHELVHTVHHNHSQRFWNKVENIMPDYKERKKWLRKHGPQLMV